MVNGSGSYTIRHLMQRYSVSAATIRNWERLGKIPPVTRTLGGHRRYDQSHLEAIDKVMMPQPQVCEG